MSSVIRINYSWRVFSGPEFPQPSCVMWAYETFDTGAKSQRKLEGLEREQAIAQVRKERADAEASGEFNQHWISEKDNIAERISRATSNSWECVVDSNGNSLPDPCAPANSDPRDFLANLYNARVHLQVNRLPTGVQTVLITISGNLRNA